MKDRAKGAPRQHFTILVKRCVDAAIANDDQKYARQLATMFERQALILRAKFNGKPLWGTESPRTVSESWLDKARRDFDDALNDVAAWDAFDRYIRSQL